MTAVTPFLWFDDNAEEAIDCYASIFPDVRVENVQRRGEKFFVGEFEIGGQRFTALNGGPHYKLTPAFSLSVNCKNQAEIDCYWERLLDGGKAMQCGWLTDRFGLTWQIVPEVLPKLINDPDPRRAERAMKAMLGMVKLDIATLEAAHRG